MAKITLEVGGQIDGREIVGVKAEEKITTAYLADGNFIVFNNTELDVEEEIVDEPADEPVEEPVDEPVEESTGTDTESTGTDTESTGTDMESIGTDMESIGTDMESIGTDMEPVEDEVLQASTDPVTGEEVTI